MNEDIPGQNIADQLSRQPASKDPDLALKGTKSWQIFDANWKDELLAQGTGHGFVNYYIPEDEKDRYATVLEGFALGYTTDEMVEGAVTLKADTIEELAEGMGLPVENVKASIERYNELAAKGVDEDYGKLGTRMFPWTRRRRSARAALTAPACWRAHGRPRVRHRPASARRRGRAHQGPVRGRQHPGRALPRGVPASAVGSLRPARSPFGACGENAAAGV